MPENDDLDPAASTQMFQAFVDRAEPEESRSPAAKAAITVGALAVVALVVVLAWVVLGG